MSQLVSVVIPHFARPGLLAEAVASIRASSYRTFEIIVVDDGSPFEDWQKVESMAATDLRVFQRGDGVKGPSRCRNIGLEQAKGTHVMFLDSDDFMAPWCLEQRLGAAEAAAEVDFVVYPVLLFHELPGDMDVLWNSMENGAPDVERFACSDPPWHTSSPLWRTASVRLLGGFNEAVFYGDDADLHLRALACGLRAVKQTEALPDVFIRRSDTPRITNTLSAFLIESRRTRLREGSRFLKSRADSPNLMAIWEGQYFVEAEFLLFNHASPEAEVDLVLKAWAADCQPSVWLRLVVAGYFKVALLCRRRLYLVLRISRRLARASLPRVYFPVGGDFHQAKVSSSTLKRVLEGLLF